MTTSQSVAVGKDGKWRRVLVIALERVEVCDFAPKTELATSNQLNTENRAIGIALTCVDLPTQ